jgi:hypothetical protein
MSVFSKRHRRAIAAGQLDVGLDKRLRGRMWRLMLNHNESFTYQPSSTDNWTETTDFMEQTRLGLLAVNGLSALRINGTKVDLKRWLAECPGEEVLDAAELFYLQLEDGSRAAYSTDLNRMLGEEDAAWRMLDGQFVLLDTVFVHEQFVASSQETLHSVRFEGAAQEILSAQHDLADQDMRGAVHNAGKSFESAMKAALGEEGHLAAKRLIESLQAAGWLDGLPEGLRGGFASQVMLALPWMRNYMGGHGQGRDEQPLPEPYARLALGLAAVFDEFIVGLAIERDSSLAKGPDQRSASAEDVPVDGSDFVLFPAGSGDDDIPF